jgi:hypothetical protein
MYARERGSLRLWRVTGGTLLPWMTLVALWRWFLNGSVTSAVCLKRADRIPGFCPRPNFFLAYFMGLKTGFRPF